MGRFFISTPIGFEQECLRELGEVWPKLLAKDAKAHDLPLPAVQVLQGGLEFEADLFTGVQLNFFLKTANRILWRLDSFKARDLPKFYQKIKAIPWQEYLAHVHVEWEIAAQKSRLNNEKRLQESASQAVLEVMKSVTGESPCATIYIRMDDDQCTVSLDTTGEHLHKRGTTVLKGEAPLRETIAAYLLSQLIGETPTANLSHIVLADPMMGAGTFLTEARSRGAGFFQRPFAFQAWKKAPKLFLSPSFALNYPAANPAHFKSYKGQDIEERMLEVVRKNFAETERQLAVSQRKSFVAADLEVRHGDSLQKVEKVTAPTWMIVNPPYGERLEKASGLKINELAARLCKAQPLKLGILFLEKLPLTVAPDGYRVAKEIKINNGGIRCLFTVLEAL